ncbi:MAG: 3'-5' exonuclease [Candidatus Xenobia bacterium]
MDLKPAILHVLTPEALSEIAFRLKLDKIDPDDGDGTAQRLMASTDATSDRLVQLLYEEELREVCETVGLPQHGARKGLIRRLLDFEQQGIPVERRRQSPRLETRLPDGPFVAIDFETADYAPDSACAVALVRVEGDQIVARQARFIRPPRRTFYFTHIHGITWNDVARERRFAEVWPELAPLLEGARFLAAHNAAFDRTVLAAGLRSAGLPMPQVPFLCTVMLARDRWHLRPTRLPDVCRHLGVALQHHNALSDAEACARIVLAAREESELVERSA